VSLPLEFRFSRVSDRGRLSASVATASAGRHTPERPPHVDLPTARTKATKATARAWSAACVGRPSPAQGEAGLASVPTCRSSGEGTHAGRDARPSACDAKLLWTSGSVVGDEKHLSGALAEAPRNSRAA
jgi:hypothetical protein